MRLKAKMPPLFLIAFLAALAMTLASSVHLRRLRWLGVEESSSGAIEAFMGESRRLFANQAFMKADEYFHSGFKPGIFAGGYHEGEDHLQAEANSDSTISKEGGAAKDDHSGHDHDSGHAAAASSDWISRFGKNFYPSEHSHLESRADEAELLPWLKLTAELNPNRIESYTVAAYWLRERLDRPVEALKFLRSGLRANPDSYPIMMELAKTCAVVDSDPGRARNLLLLALEKWRAQEANKVRRDVFGLQQILVALIKLEEDHQRWEQAMEYLEMLKPLSPMPDQVQERIDELKEKI